MRAKPSHAYYDLTTSEFTNLQQTALNCCQPLSAPYKRQNRYFNEIIRWVPLKRLLNRQETVTHCLLFILQPIYSHNSAHVFTANHIPRLPMATLSIGHLTLKMTFALVVETSVANNSPSQDSSHPDDHFQSRYVTPGFKPLFYLSRLLLKSTLYMSDIVYLQFLSHHCFSHFKVCSELPTTP